MRRSLVSLLLCAGTLGAQQINPNQIKGHVVVQQPADSNDQVVIQPGTSVFRVNRSTMGSLNSTQNPAAGIAPYTADITGSSDSTAAIQAAIDYAFDNGFTSVELPAGNFKIGSTGLPLFMRSNVTLKGPGVGTARLLPVNGRKAPIASWSCTAGTGTCTSGTAPYTITLTLTAPVFDGLQNYDSFCNVSGSNCSLFTYFGFVANHGFYGMFGGALNGVFVGENRPVLPASSWWTTTSFSIIVQIPPSANSGSGGTFFLPINPIQTYDARNAQKLNAVGYGFRDLVLDGGCTACDTNSFAYFDSMLSIQARPGGGNPTIYVNGSIENVTIQNAPTNGVSFISTDTVRIRNLHCHTISQDCIGGQDASNMNMDGILADNMGFPFHWDGVAGFGTSVYNQLLTSATHGVTLRNVTFIPNATYPNLAPYVISGFQNGTSPDAYHRLVHDWIVDGIYQRDACLVSGGIATVFVDNLQITNVVDDISACAVNDAPRNGEGFIEIGGNNNHVSNGQNVHVTWAGIDNTFLHASNIEVDHIQWKGFFVHAGVVSVSGAQGGLEPSGCTVDNINIHDVQANFTLVSPSNASASIAGIGYGEGSGNCTLRNVSVHDNLGTVNTVVGIPSTSSAFELLGTGDQYNFHGNRAVGFPRYVTANCNNDQVGAHDYGTVVTNFLIDADSSDLAIGDIVLDKTTLPGCPANWTGVSTWGGNSWAGVDYNRSHAGVTGTITGSSNACVTGTASNAQFKVGATGAAPTRSDGAALLSSTNAKLNVASNGTATVTVCSGSSAEPAGTYNVQVTNLQ